MINNIGQREIFSKIETAKGSLQEKANAGETTDVFAAADKAERSLISPALAHDLKEATRTAFYGIVGVTEFGLIGLVFAAGIGFSALTGVGIGAALGLAVVGALKYSQRPIKYPKNATPESLTPKQKEAKSEVDKITGTIDSISKAAIQGMPEVKEGRIKVSLANLGINDRVCSVEGDLGCDNNKIIKDGNFHLRFQDGEYVNIKFENLDDRKGKLSKTVIDSKKNWVNKDQKDFTTEHIVADEKKGTVSYRKAMEHNSSTE